MQADSKWSSVESLWPWLLALAVLAAVYLPVLRAPFMWDDQGAILYNPSLERAIPLSGYFGPDYFRLSGETSWRPLATASYNALVLLAGKSPAVLRSSSLLLHLACACLLALLLRRSGLGRTAAALAAALFLAHPAHAETLLCASFNEELLAALGLLLMLLAHGRGWTAAACAALLFALGAKETAAAALPLAALLDWCRLGGRGVRRSLPRYGAYALVIAGFAAYSVLALGGAGFSASASVPALERLYFALESLWHFVRVQVLPVRLRIEYFAIPPTSAIPVLSLTAFAAAAADFAAVGFSRLAADEERRPLALYLAWPFLFWLGFSGLLPAGMLSTRLMAERWLYLPLLGTCALAGFALERRPRLAAGLLLALGALGFLRAADWSDERRLWRSLVSVYPWSAKAHEGLGDACARARDDAPALAAFEEALRLRETRQDPLLAYYVPIAHGHLRWESPSLQRSLGTAYLRDAQTARAESHLLRAIELAPNNPLPYRALSYLYASLGRFPDAAAMADAGLVRLPSDGFLLRLREDARRRKLSFKAIFY